MKRISLLDCTLRDGAYITNSDFGDAAIRGIIGKLEEAGAEIIECGWLKNDLRKEGSTFFHQPSDLTGFLRNKDVKKTYVAMIDWDRYDLNYLPQNDGKSIDAIRVVFPYSKYKEGINVGEKISEKGYRVFFQAANTLAYSEADLVNLAHKVNESSAEALSIVDTFGAMFPEDLERIFKILDKELSSEISIGLHSHNNQQLSFSNSIEFVKLINSTSRYGIIDSSLCGMGRGAGNATTELVASFLNRKCGAHYDLDAIMDAIDTYMEPFKEKFEWGYSTPYFISGLYCCHVNNIAYLLKNHRTNAKDMRNIIESLSQEDRKKYDYDLLEEKYLKNQSYKVNDENDCDEFKKFLFKKKIILIAPGKSSVTQKNEIDKFISENDTVVIGINAILKDYRYDLLLFSNSARYEYAKNAYPEVFENTTHVIFSNIKNVSENEIIIDFNSVIKRGWKYYDNAVICSLRLLEKLGISEVYISGFDGFKNAYNESYADDKLPTLNAAGDWDNLNKEINDMFLDFVDKANIKVYFLTETIYGKNLNECYKIFPNKSRG